CPLLFCQLHYISFRHDVPPPTSMANPSTLQNPRGGLVEGVSAHSAQRLQQRLAAAGMLPRTQELGTELLQFVREEGAKAKAGERLVGSSEVIESIFGKWKRVEGEQARSGLTGLVLALGALVAPTTPAVIKQALESVPTKTVLAWCREKLGKTVQALRR